MFLLTKVSFSIHKGWQSLIIANNALAVQCGFIYTVPSFISNTVEGSRSNPHLYSLLSETVTGIPCCHLSLKLQHEYGDWGEMILAFQRLTLDNWSEKQIHTVENIIALSLHYKFPT